MRERIAGKEMKLFVYASNMLLYILAFVCDSPQNILTGLVQIVISRDALITDYFALGGMGAAFLNAALVMSIAVVLIEGCKIPFTGPTLAVLYINAGYALWGKNVMNILPILLGTFLYAKLHHAHFGRYIYTALFGTGLAPFVTEMLYLLPFSKLCNFFLAVVMGIFIGFIISPLSMHTASMHMGYNLFNVGFAGGILAFVLVSVFRSFGLESEPVQMWQEGAALPVIIGTYVYFLVAIAYGLWINRGKLDGLWHIFHHPGRAVADFVLMDGPGATLMNMGLVGIIGLTYILLIGGDLCGPILGAIWMAFGFAAFGAHVRNYLPVLAGVFAFTFFSKYTPVTPGIQLAAIFAVGLSPIAGQFGIIPGIVAGMLHSAIVMCTTVMYGGLSLYNNGFSAGWVAIFMVPTIESFMKHFETGRHTRKQREQREKK